MLLYDILNSSSKPNYLSSLKRSTFTALLRHHPEVDPEPEAAPDSDSTNLVRFTNIGTCASAFGDPPGPITGDVIPFPFPPGEAPEPNVGEITPIIEFDVAEFEDVLRGIYGLGGGF